MLTCGKLGPEMPVLARHQIMAEIEAQTQSRELALNTVFRATIKSRKEQRALSGWHTRPIVAHRNQRHLIWRHRHGSFSEAARAQRGSDRQAVYRASLHSHLDHLLVTPKLAGIIKQIAQRLLQSRRIRQRHQERLPGNQT